MFLHTSILFQQPFSRNVLTFVSLYFATMIINLCNEALVVSLSLINSKTPVKG